MTASITTSLDFSDVEIDPTNPNTLYVAVGNAFAGQAATGIYKSTMLFNLEQVNVRAAF